LRETERDRKLCSSRYKDLTRSKSDARVAVTNRDLAGAGAVRQIFKTVLVRKRRRGRLLTIAVGATIALQIPMVLTIGRLAHHPGVSAAGAGIINVPFLLAMRNPWRDWGRSRLWLYLGLWPFFVWGAICIAFALVAPIGLLAALLTPLALDRALAICAAAAVVIGLRSLSGRPRVAALNVAVPDLPPAFDGFVIAQISDVHCGPLTPPARVERWVERVNALGADLVAVTGDLITSGDGYVTSVAAALGRLRARDGVFACMGNHDYFTDAEALAHALERGGISVLRNRGVTLARGEARLYVGGVDDTWTKRDDVAGTMAGCPAGATSVLLAHDPNLFPQAVAEGADLVLSGHTHGGQFAVPGFARRWNLARVVTSFTTGLYRQGQSALYVNRGLGTTGPPIRLGAGPEIALLTLRPAGAEQQDRRSADAA
jgi:predicted MPP superfamily phosphohydrolase